MHSYTWLGMVYIFFSIVRIEHAHTKLIWQYIVFYKVYFDEKLPSTSCLCHEFTQRYHTAYS